MNHCLQHYKLYLLNSPQVHGVEDKLLIVRPDVVWHRSSEKFSLNKQTNK